MLAAVALDMSVKLRGALWSALVAFVAQTPRDRLFAVIVLLVIAVDFGIPLVTFACLSVGGCPLLHP